jgi:hypothetical protein
VFLRRGSPSKNHGANCQSAEIVEKKSFFTQQLLIFIFHRTYQNLYLVPSRSQCHNPLGCASLQKKQSKKTPAWERFKIGQRSNKLVNSGLRRRRKGANAISIFVFNKRDVVLQAGISLSARFFFAW